VFDVLGAMNHRGLLEMGLAKVVGDPPIGFYDQLSDHSTLDQPPLREALFDALARSALACYLLPPTWNFRGWKTRLGTTTKDQGCCVPTVSKKRRMWTTAAVSS